MLRKIVRLLGQNLFRLLDLLTPKVKEVSVFGSKGGDYYYDNSRYLYEFFLKENGTKNTYWISNKEEESLPGEVLVIGTWKYYKVLLLAKNVFVSYGMFDVGPVRFSNRTVVVQLWHGMPMKYIFKKIKGISLFERLSHSYEIINYTYFLACNDIDKKNIIYCTGLKDNKVLVTGYPRHDHLTSGILEKKELASLKRQYSKIILMAPTFRDSGESLFSMLKNDEWMVLLSILEENDCLMMLRAHKEEFHRDKRQGIDSIFNAIGASKHIVFVGNDEYPDVQDLLIITDVLISDYSGILYDFSLISKLAIRYCPDLDSYRKKRGLISEFEDLEIGSLCLDFQSLERKLRSILMGCEGKIYRRTKVCEGLYRKLLT